ncbi:MAG: hypothetical protein HC834_00365 [Rhodospirillales bacterium]|nr:hypothetical protein [Rhodospirillales bacterium]
MDTMHRFDPSARSIIHRHVLGVACGVLMLSMASSPGIAQTGSEWTAQVKGVGGQPVAAGTVMRVVAEEFDDLNNRLQPVIEQALIANGFRVDPDATLQLVFSTELSNATAGAYSDEPPTADEVGDIDEDLDMSDQGPFAEPTPGEYEGREPIVGVEPQITIPFGKAGKSNTETYSLSFILGAAGRTPLWQGG